MNAKWLRIVPVVLGLVVLSCGVAQAQTPAKRSVGRPAAVSAEPRLTVATYGDWVVRCQRLGAAGQNGRVCEVAETIRLRGRQAPVAEVAIGRLSARESLRVTVVVPPAVAFPSSVRLSGGKAGPALTLEWRRCLPGGCFADAPISRGALAQWRGLTAPGRMTFKGADGRDATLPLSFRGLAQALDALARER